MSFRYLQEPGEVFSLPNCLAGLRSQRSKSAHTVKKSSCSGSETDSSKNSQSGEILDPFTEAPGGGWLMLSAEVSPVRMCRMPGRGWVSVPENIRDYGRSLLASLAKLNLRLRSLKTPRTLPLADWILCYRILPRWGTMQDGVVWEQGNSARFIIGKGSSFLPTPMKFDAYRHQMMPRNGDQLSIGPSGYLSRLRKRDGFKITVGLAELYIVLTGCRMPPEVPEQMMEWVIGWSGLKPLATGKFQEWQQQHSGFFPKD